LVPSQTWKVVIVIPAAAGDDVARVTNSTRTIAVIMPNTQGIRTVDWKTYRVSVDQVEALTGFDFFSNVPVGTQAVIESVVDNQ
jgi:endonuclease G